MMIINEIAQTLITIFVSSTTINIASSTKNFIIMQHVRMPSQTYMQQLCKLGVVHRPLTILAELHTNEVGVKVKREVRKQLRVSQNVLKLICITRQINIVLLRQFQTTRKFS